jgi:menaquinone-9 beta-reductase
MKKLYDVIIVGGGPAGATAGIVLAREGLDVLVLEKKKFPRFKLCGGMITRKTIEIGREIMPGFAREMELKGIIEKKSKEYCIRSPDRQLFQGRSEQPFVLINREKYDSLWMDQLIQAGATVSIDRVVRVDISESKIVTHSGKKYQGKFIVGADGSGSRVRRALSRQKIVRPPGSEGAALALETFVERDKAPFTDQPELFLGLVRDGYGWSFPGNKTQVLGICSAMVKDGRILKGLLLDLLESQGVAYPGDHKIQAHILPYGDFEKKPGYKNVHLVGDAAGLAEPLLGEGIYYAHVSGSLSARAILENINKPDQSCDSYVHNMNRIIRSMRRRLVFRKLTLGLPPFLADKTFRVFLPLLAPLLERKIQGKHAGLRVD